jgi:hypothetical protein
MNVAERENHSIHLRVVNGRTMYAKVNTCLGKRPETIARAIAGISRHLEAHPHDAMAATRLAKLRSAS